MTDDDCADTELCLCDSIVQYVPAAGGGLQSEALGTGGVCVPATCRSDDDCEAGYHCASETQCTNLPMFHCQSASDECSVSVACDDGLQCEYDALTEHRTCQGVVCGRPFLVEAAARTAAVIAGNAWAKRIEITPWLEHLTASERARLTEHWTQMGQMEHASIAAFARFGLQLLALGAPAELLVACSQAMADETAHTELCFRIASVYAGRAISPGPLDVSRSLESTSLLDVVDLVIAEGCFGETSAALEALEAAELAADPVIVAAYRQIARDEQRHAELAFQFLRWALGVDPLGVTDRITRALANPPTRDEAALAVSIPCLQALSSRAAAAC